MQHQAWGVPSRLMESILQRYHEWQNRRDVAAFEAARSGWGPTLRCAWRQATFRV